MSDLLLVKDSPTGGHRIKGGHALRFFQQDYSVHCHYPRNYSNKCYNGKALKMEAAMSFKQILGAIRRADLDYDLIHDGDRICIGVSGGKDSLLLLYALSTYRRITMKYDHKSFSVLGIHLEMGFPGMDFTDLRAFLHQQDIPYLDYPTRIYDILKLYPDKEGKIQCSRCSTLKKGAIVNAAIENGCNKTAFAHHADDAIETLVLNMIYGGRINVFEPAMHLERKNMDFIRPLIYCSEEDIRRTASQELHLPIVLSGCPNDGYTKRAEVKDMLSELYKKYPQARENMLTSLSNQEQLKLWVKSGNHERKETK